MKSKNSSKKANPLYWRTLCDKSFYHFVKIIGGHVGEGIDISSIIHKPICDFWQDDSITRKAIFMPRKWLKSTIYTQWGVIWRYLQDNNIKILIVSQSENIAKRFLHFIQHQLIHNQRLKQLYPETQQITQEWKKFNRFSSTACDLPRSKAFKEPTISSIGITGAAQSGHYDMIIIDDPVGEKHRNSIVELEKVFFWFDNVNELLADYEKSIVSIHATFWGPQDFGTYVMENYPQFYWRIAPALKDSDLKDTEKIKYIQHPDVGHFKSNWPEMYDTQTYIDLMTNPQSASIFWAQHMNNPKRAKGVTKFDINWLKYFRFDINENERKTIVPLDKEGNPEEQPISLDDIRLYGMIDPGGFSEVKLSKAGSRNAVVIGGQKPGSLKKFIVYIWCGKLKAPEDFINEVFKADKEWNPQHWKIETVGAQEYIKRDIQQARKERGHYLSISSMDPEPNKDAKHDDIQALINPMFNGEIYIHESMRDLKAEIMNYPTGFTVDLIDMMGKLNKYYWSRKPKTTNKGNMWKDYGHFTRNKITGY